MANHILTRVPMYATSNSTTVLRGVKPVVREGYKRAVAEQKNYLLIHILDQTNYTQRKSLYICPEGVPLHLWEIKKHGSVDKRSPKVIEACIRHYILGTKIS